MEDAHDVPTPTEEPHLQVEEPTQSAQDPKPRVSKPVKPHTRTYKKKPGRPFGTTKAEMEARKAPPPPSTPESVTGIPSESESEDEDDEEVIVYKSRAGTKKPTRKSQPATIDIGGEMYEKLMQEFQSLKVQIAESKPKRAPPKPRQPKSALPQGEPEPEEPPKVIPKATTPRSAPRKSVAPPKVVAATNDPYAILFA